MSRGLLAVTINKVRPRLSNLLYRLWQSPALAPIRNTYFDDPVGPEKAEVRVGPYRVPAVYLTSAFLWFFAVLLFRRINNLRRINPPEGFDSHPGHNCFHSFFRCKLHPLRDQFACR